MVGAAVSRVVPCDLARMASSGRTPARASRRLTPTRSGVLSAMAAIGVALNTSEHCGPVRLDALTPPAHACIPRVALCTPPLLGPGQDTAHPRTPRPAPPVC